MLKKLHFWYGMAFLKVSHSSTLGHCDFATLSLVVTSLQGKQVWNMTAGVSCSAWNGAQPPPPCPWLHWTLDLNLQNCPTRSNCGSLVVFICWTFELCLAGALHANRPSCQTWQEVKFAWTSEHLLKSWKSAEPGTFVTLVTGKILFPSHAKIDKMDLIRGQGSNDLIRPLSLMCNAMHCSGGGNRDVYDAYTQLCRAG